MKPKRTADLSLFLTVIGLLLTSLAFVAKDSRCQTSTDTNDKPFFLPISQNPDSMIPPDDEPYPGDNQPELNENAAEYAAKMDSVLNFVYQSILRKYSVDTQFIRYFKRAEAAWIKYRDAEMLAIMPPDLPGELYSSIEAECQLEYRSAFARQRIGELLMWLHAPEDKTGCDTFYTDDELQAMRKNLKTKSKK